VDVSDMSQRQAVPPSFDMRGQRHRDADGLRRVEALLQKTQQLSSTGTFSWVASTDHMVWSEELYRIFGLGPASQVTLGLVRQRIHPDDLSSFQKMITCARETGADLEGELRLQMSDGSAKHLRLSAHATRDQHGRLEYLGAIQDATARKAAQETLDGLRAQLTHVARISSVGALTASIAHELNQPLGGIVANANACRRMLAIQPPDLKGARRTLRRTIRDAERAAAIVTGLRSLFRKQGPGDNLVDLNQATREVIKLMLRELQRNRVVLRMDLAPDLPPVSGDRVQLQQVVLNLLLNASDAMTQVRGRARSLVVTSACDEDAWARISVQDAGVGVGPQALERLFEPFYTTKTHGMGVGLTVSRAIIESHGGRLWATPNSGVGATFAFSVPCSRPSGSPAANSDATATQAQAKSRLA
jgi:PAS domain S-box-containing protein